MLRLQEMVVGGAQTINDLSAPYPIYVTGQARHRWTASTSMYFTFPMSEYDRGPGMESIASSSEISVPNPLIDLIGQLDVFLFALEQYQSAGTSADLKRCQKNWRSLTRPFWETHRIPNEAIRTTLDPILAWLQNTGFGREEYFAIVKSGAEYLTAIAMHRPCALPDVYANSDDAKSLWARQLEFILASRAVHHRLRELAAKTGRRWQWDGRLPWDHQSQMARAVSGAISDVDTGKQQQRPKPTRKSTAIPEKRSWTQRDLDNRLREYKAERASTYNDLVDGVKRGRAGAKKIARDLFGRNAVVRALGVKSAAMVSNSRVWQDIADELKLRGSSRSKSRRHPQRIGLKIAMEDQAQATSAPILDQAVQQETIRLIEKSMPSAEAEATIEKLRRGDITDDAARELVDVFAQQERDKRTRKVRQTP